MDEQEELGAEIGGLPFHEYCAQCNRRFDETILDPTVTIVETAEESVLHSFCDEQCLTEWASDES